MKEKEGDGEGVRCVDNGAKMTTGLMLCSRKDGRIIDDGLWNLRRRNGFLSDRGRRFRMRVMVVVDGAVSVMVVVRMMVMVRDRR